MSKNIKNALLAIALLILVAYPTLTSGTEVLKSWRRRTSERRKSAEELGVPECKSNFDCVTSGVCVKDRSGKGRCFCSSSCPLIVPVQCTENNHYSCVSMGDSYISKYDMRSPLCYHKRCICPPQFDPQFVLSPAPSFNTRLPMKCDKRELDVALVATPSSSVTMGSVAYLFCCVNLDPRTFISKDGVVFVQNGSIRRQPTSTPYESFSHDIDTYFSVPTCWVLAITNAQLSDSGTYNCMVHPANARYRIINATMEFSVKEMLRKKSVTISPNKTSVTVSWEQESGAELQVDMKLYKESTWQTIEMKRGVKSPVVFYHLSPATSYKLEVNVTDGQNEPLKITENTMTLSDFPNPPILDGIGIVDAEDGNGEKLCKVEWRPSRSDTSMDQVKRYFVQISGRIRYVSPESKVPPLDHYPQSVDCSRDEQKGHHYIDSDNSRTFFSCKYGPLKPNRNYSATVWAENNAGRSIAVSINSRCMMDFAEPAHIEPPIVASRPNISSFGLIFEREPSQENGPIACYYLAILPLPLNVSIDVLPTPTNVTVDTFDKALKNNQDQHAINNKQFFAYIAESYTQFPKQTVVGDRDTSAGIDPCNVRYMTRYTPSDSALIPQLKYTGFLIARVDRDRNFHSPDQQGHPSPLASNRSVRQIKFGAFPMRWRRQLTDLDPAYGFSGYFKPVPLQVGGTGGISSLEILLISFFVLTFLALSTTIVVYFMHKKGIIKQFCCPSKKGSHDLLRPGIPPAPIRSDDLPAEYILKHRDSDYQFTQEFEMLPRGKNLDHTISERKENARKNRYNDIKACDATRVRLRRVPGDPNFSDYINANFIKGYKGRKCFIATQGPLECTIGDFWRMIWEQGSRMIIMVTNLRERGREQCVKYWPDDDEHPLAFRTLEVAAVNSSYFADYTLRVFEMSDTEPPPQPARGNGRVNSAGEKSLCSGTGNNTPFEENARLAGGNSPSPPPSLPLIQATKADPMNNSAFSIHSRSSHDIHSTIQRRRHDSEYANISSIIRPQSKSSGRVSVVEGRERRRVLQFHFISWNDYKAPECTIALLKLLYKLRKMDEFNHSPVVIHCSAGVGRTGTLVAIDYVMDQMLDLGVADVFTCVSEMRQQRNLMVQSVEQYVFIYKALAEFQLFGDTDLTIVAFRRHFGRLRQPLQTIRERHLSLGGGASSRSSSVQLSEEHPRQRTASIAQREKEGITTALRTRLRLLRDGNLNAAGEGLSAKMQNGGAAVGVKIHRPRNQLELEFQDLSITLEKPKSTELAHKEENQAINRFFEAVPFNFNRVVLHPMIGYDNTYLNASFVKGYFYPYILAQDPMSPETVFDFWRMINDQQSYTIVMLSTEEDFLPQEIYWPREVSKRLIFGKNNELSITLAEEIELPGFVQRKLHYRFKQSDKSVVASGRDVLQFSFRQWKSCAPTPNSPSALLDLIGRVLERQSNIQDAGPIVLHCRDGSAENGVFSCVSLLLERLRSEQLIDVFRTVRALQLQRPLLLSKIEQYAFCYECVMEYLNTCK